MVKKTTDIKEIEYKGEKVATYRLRNIETENKFKEDEEIEWKGKVAIVEGMSDEEFEEMKKEAEKEWEELKDEIITPKKRGEPIALGKATGTEVVGALKIIQIKSNYSIFWLVWREYTIKRWKQECDPKKWTLIEMKAEEATEKIKKGE